MKGNPAAPGGSLKSKPTWSDALGVLFHVGFFRTAALTAVFAATDGDCPVTRRSVRRSTRNAVGL